MSDIREKAEALIKAIEDAYCAQDLIVGSPNQLAKAEEFQALKAALRPSRGEIASYLQMYKEWLDCKQYLPIPPEYPNRIREYMNLAIEELRK